MAAEPNALPPGTYERIDGPTPAGGAYAIAYFFDDDGTACPEEDAVEMRIIEYDESDKSIAFTYGEIDQEAKT